VTGFIGVLRTLAGWALLAAATALVVIALQWQAPERSVEPVASRFICDGQVAVGSTDGEGADVFRDVVCLEGRSADDITMLTMIVLAVPVALIIGTSALLFRRFMAPHQRTRIRRATT
jgi:hypothetical protein